MFEIRTGSFWVDSIVHSTQRVKGGRRKRDSAGKRVSEPVFSHLSILLNTSSTYLTVTVFGSLWDLSILSFISLLTAYHLSPNHTFDALSACSEGVLVPSRALTVY